jgi:hypothetical protein
VPLPRSTAAIDATCVAPGSMETTVAIRPVRDFAANIHHPQPIGTGVAVRSGITRRYDDTVVPLATATLRLPAPRRGMPCSPTVRNRSARRRRPASPAQSAAQTATIDSADTLRGYLVEDLARLERQQAMATVAARTPR